MSTCPNCGKDHPSNMKEMLEVSKRISIDLADCYSQPDAMFILAIAASSLTAADKPKEHILADRMLKFVKTYTLLSLGK